MSQIGAVAVSADAVSCAALKNGADQNLRNAGLNDLRGLFFRQHGVVFCNDFTGRGIHHIADDVPSEQTVLQRFNDFVPVHNVGHKNALCCAAVFLADDHVLCHIDEPAGQVTGVCRFQSRIRQGFTRAAGGDEVLQDVQAFAEV